MSRNEQPTREDLIDLRFKHGMTREQMAEHYSVSIATIRRWIKDLSVPRIPKKKRNKHLTPSGELIVPAGDGYTPWERALIELEGRVLEVRGKGYYLDGKPASVDDIIAASHQM